jgi:hypothetical protein
MEDGDGLDVWHCPYGDDLQLLCSLDTLEECKRLIREHRAWHKKQMQELQNAPAKQLADTLEQKQEAFRAEVVNLADHTNLN